jgi:hypothetical protein
VCSCVPFLCWVLSSVDVGPVDVTCDGQVLLSCDLLTGLVTDGVFFASFLVNLFVLFADCLRVVFQILILHFGPFSILR